MTERVITQLLQEMDGIHTLKHVWRWKMNDHARKIKFDNSIAFFYNVDKYDNAPHSKVGSHYINVW